MLRSILGGYIGIPAAKVGFTYGAFGKPILDPARTRSDLKFNLAHKKNALLEQSQAVLAEAKGVEELNRQLEEAYERLRPVLKQQKRTVDTLTTLSRLRLINGHSAASGGSIRNDGTLTVTKCTLSGNSAAFGGAIANGGTLTVNLSTFNGNTCSNYGGAIFNDAAVTLNSRARVIYSVGCTSQRGRPRDGPLVLPNPITCKDF